MMELYHYSPLAGHFTQVIYLHVKLLFAYSVPSLLSSSFHYLIPSFLHLLNT